MSKVVLSDPEVSLIKGLIQHAGFNDQQVLAIFSFLERNFNHRVVGAVRTNAKPGYAKIPAASKADVDALLYDYAKISALAESLGFYTADAEGAQIRKAVEIFKTAILIYNSNVFITRSETFIVLSIIAWTYILHVKLRKSGVVPIYNGPDGRPILIDGQPKLWELSYCVERPEAGLSPPQKANLKYLIAIRNAIEHRSCDDINDDVQSKVQANALNFLSFLKSRFGGKYDFSNDISFSIQLQALTLKSPNLLKGPGQVAKSVSAVNALLEGPMTEAEFNDPAYAFRVYVVPKVTNNAKKADQAVIYSPVGSDVEVAIKLVEKPKFRMADAVKKLRDEKLQFTDYQFIQAWKAHNLKDPAKGLAVQLGGQWFWYQEGIDRIREILFP